MASGMRSPGGIRYESGTVRKTIIITEGGVCLPLAAGLREALAERLGVEAREIGVATGPSSGPAGEVRLTAFLFDRAARGAGYVARLTERETFEASIKRAAKQLDCPENCAHGCAACVLRPDLNLHGLRLDRPGGHAAAETLRKALVLPHLLRVFGPETSPLGQPASEWIATRHRRAPFRRIVLFLHGDPALWEVGAWPLAMLFPRLAAAGTDTVLVLPAWATSSSGLDLSNRIALGRLASPPIRLTTLARLPEVARRPIIASVAGSDTALAIAADPTEALPGRDWGAGALAPVVAGLWSVADDPKPLDLDAEALVRDGLAGARLLWLGAGLDGPLEGFGARFWRLVHEEASLAFTALSSAGTAAITYSDRYVLTPLNLALLREVLTAASGSKDASVTVALAPVDRSGTRVFAVHDAYPEDALRRDVLRQLLPAARVIIAARKTDLPHHRRLEFALKDGRRVTILLDQGFGGWRAGVVRHDFVAAPAAQARAIAALGTAVSAAEPRGYPATIEISRAA